MKKIAIISLVIAVIYALFFVGITKNEIRGDLIIFTQIPSGIFNPRSVFPEKSRIVSINVENPESSFEILTVKFLSARSPQVSYDGARLLFAGKRDESQNWQIWEMNLISREITQITSEDLNCTDPVYLPDGSILFSREIQDKITGQGFALYKVNKTGNVERITFQPHLDLLSTVTRDGRIITNSRQIYPEIKDPKLLALRPDGTKVVLHYRPVDGLIPVSRGYETSDNRFVFVEKKAENQAGKLVSISLFRPLNSRNVLAGGSDKTGFHSVYPYDPGRLIVAYREDPKSVFGLYIFNLKEKEQESEIYIDQEFHSIEAVTNKSRSVPKKLPSQVTTSAGTGKLLCMNSSITDLPAEEGIKPHFIRLLGIEEQLGKIKIENDGSFYIEIAADTPIRFQALDEQGHEILDPSSWLWVRPNESKGCVGCHENREMAPANFVPEAITQDPVSLKSLEKAIATE